ncbi:MAG: glutamine-hydrolyzing GMP synthase [Bdellovibrionaceae bacterium]|nr:glutamine-hydrolyzing GMP synthase [Pseudobdellovibrionaceae bacterium]
MRGFLILDFGSQVTQLIARRFRELGYYSEIYPWNVPLETLKAKKPWGLILSGGPNSVYEATSPRRSVQELEEIAPLLGICYGMQLMAHDLGGKVSAGHSREYGFQEVRWSHKLSGVPTQQKVWMSHGDVVEKAPPGFEIWAKTTAHVSAMGSARSWAVQFHPEVAHTENGTEVLQAFAKHSGATADWKPTAMLESIQASIIKQVKPEDHILCGLSGGVDSTVVATMLTRLLGPERVHCVFVNNGLLRHQEFEEVAGTYKKLGLNIKAVDASHKFLSELKGVVDPEKKRKIIGRVFIEVFEAEIDPAWNIQWLAQGTLYPDVIESVSVNGGSVTIKSHHNVGGLPEKMKLKLLEPVRELFKDEVRRLGAELDIPEAQLWRHPFPGPGLAIRVIGEVNEENLALLRKADHIFVSALREKGLYGKIWQAFCVLLPVSTVGVMGDARTYDKVLALRAVTSTDGMTADWVDFESTFLREVSNRITNQVRGISRVVYDITSKPPSTIEWE